MAAAGSRRVAASDQVSASGNRRVLPYIYRVGRTFVVRLAKIAGAAEKTFPFESDEEALHALERATHWRDRRATPAMQASILRAAGRPAGRASNLRERSRSKAAKTGIRVVRELGLVIAFDVTCSRPHGAPLLTRRFSVNKHGEEMALLYAVRQRLEWEARHWGVQTRITDQEWALLVQRWTRLYPGKVFAPEKLSHPGSVTEPYPNLYQARVMVKNELHSRTFSAKNYASAWEARLAAVLWLISFEEAAARPKLYTYKAKSGEGTREGVSRCETQGRRGIPEVVYQVSFKDPVTGKQRNKKFSAGAVAKLTPEKDQKVATAARAFRAAYEAWAAGGTPFHPDQWSNWRAAFGIEATAEDGAGADVVD